MTGVADKSARATHEPSPDGLGHSVGVANAVLPADVIQITEGHHWSPALAIVSEVKSWGVQAYVLMPHNDGTPPGAAFIRVPNGQYEFIGEAVLGMPCDLEARAQAIEARRAETGTGSACESAVRQDAPDTPDLSTPLPSGSIER